MPYFKREPVADRDVLRRIPRPFLGAQPVVEDPSPESIVARASRILDAETGPDGGTSLWPADCFPFTTSEAFAALPTAFAAIDARENHDVPALTSNPVRGGETAVIEMRVANDLDTPATVTFVGTGLVSAAGFVVGPEQVTFTPPQAVVPPGGETVIEIRIAMPAVVVKGIYSGLVVSTAEEPLRAVVAIPVV
jgi:hypothetical protein